MSLVSFRIIDAADQQFSASLGGRRTTMRLRYNPTIDRWSFNLAIDDQMVLHGRRIVTGVDLLRPFEFGIGVVFAAADKIMKMGENTIMPEAIEPGRSALIGGIVKLYHATEEDIANAAAIPS